MSDHCAFCGKADAKLKACKACKLVKYCSRDGQVAQWSAQNKACKKAFNERLYAQPPQSEECPICMITLPYELDESVYMACCGKFICLGCRYCLHREICPFCNTAYPESYEEENERLSERMEKYKDTKAINLLAIFYRDGLNGLPVDQSKAFELYQRASDLGCDAGHYRLGDSYRKGEGTEIDKKKAVHHYQVAAIMGNVYARHSLGVVELDNKNYQRAMKHFMIAAKCGFKDSLDNVKRGYKDGHVTKEDFETTLRAYQASCDETKSEQRDRAVELLL